MIYYLLITLVYMSAFAPMSVTVIEWVIVCFSEWVADCLLQWVSGWLSVTVSGWLSVSEWVGDCTDKDSVWSKRGTTEILWNCLLAVVA